MSPLDADLRGMAEGAAEIAREAGGFIAHRFGGRRDERMKGSSHNLVTDVDEAAERLIVERLASFFPGQSVIAEEGGSQAGSRVTWFVDPLDGTNNYAHGIPIFSVSLAATRGNEVLCGVTYDPLRDEMFKAVRGEGAWLNGTPIRVSKRGVLAESVVATGFPYDKAYNPDNNIAQFAAVAPRVRGIRRLGSAALDLAYVACARFDAYWERGTRAWDVATGILLVTEAGGSVSDYDGSPARIDGGRFVASNGLIHAELIGVLESASIGESGAPTEFRA